MTERILLKDLDGNLIGELSIYKKFNLEFVEEENGCQRVVSHNGIFLSSVENKECQNLVLHFISDFIDMKLQPIEKENQ